MVDQAYFETCGKSLAQNPTGLLGMVDEGPKRASSVFICLFSNANLKLTPV